MTLVPRAMCAVFAAVAMAIAIGATPAAAKTVTTSPIAGGHHIEARGPNYEVTVSDAFSDPNGSQAYGSASCESGWTVVGGGVATPGMQGGLGVDVNSSYPINGGWAAYMNNTSGAGATFVVQAICVKKAPKRYTVVQAVGQSQPETENSVFATCPAKTKVLGGGGFSSSGELTVGLNSTFPMAPDPTYGWAAYMGNNSPDAGTVTAFAICGVASHYSITNGTKVDNPEGQETQAPTVNCLGTTVVTGGGDYTTSSLPAVQLETTEQLNEVSWLASENNMSDGDSSVQAVAVCAKYAPE